VVQIPVYLLLWDATFYVLHRWVLHLPLFYKLSHVNHHVYRPPTAWSGIAIDPFDVIFEGIAPYLVPLFCRLPFHEHTVNAVNAVLMLHALILHSSCHREYSELPLIGPFMGWLMISPVGHNMHHNYGEKNACNFGAIFKIFDRMGGP
jgi:sterol desaturase/sphingolipid hydroxylase (fatty acid hydroxylase superfamily)